jgi:hypothetical protein
MKAEHLAAYFRKKIAKPIPYSVYIEREQGGPIYWLDELETTAVDEDDLHMMVSARFTQSPACI